MSSKKRLLVIGDVILDIYHLGKVDRISPEAPIPIFVEEKTEYKAGGAANLAKNLAGLGFEVTMMTPKIYPSDDLTKLSEVLDSQPEVGFCFGDDVCNLIWKRRYIDTRNYHQVGLRHDNDALVKRATLGFHSFQLFRKIADSFSAVIFSDYCKGSLNSVLFCKNIIETCRNKDIPTFLDTRRKEFYMFEGIKYFKPNMSEFKIYLEQASEGVCFDNVLRTESENGMSFIERGSLYSINEYVHIPSAAHNIVDPTGAGDTAMAGWVYGIVKKYSNIDSMHIANNLAAIACRNRGTYVVNSGDLKDAIACLPQKTKEEEKVRYQETSEGAGTQETKDES